MHDEVSIAYASAKWTATGEPESRRPLRDTGIRNSAVVIRLASARREGFTEVQRTSETDDHVRDRADHPDLEPFELFAEK